MNQYNQPYVNIINPQNARNDPSVNSEILPNLTSFNTSSPTTGSDPRSYNNHPLAHTLPPNHYSNPAPVLQQTPHFNYSRLPVQIKLENFSRRYPTDPLPSTQYHAYCPDSEVRNQITPFIPLVEYPTYSQPQKSPGPQTSEPSDASAPLELEKKQCVNCAELTKLVERLEKRVQDLSSQVEKPVGINGTFTWRISDVSKQPNGGLESPVFYTSGLGYKLHGCVYLKGDRESAGKCVSAYITLLKGEYDSLLDWPFQYPVSISLIDQSLKGKDFVKTFQPTRTSSCFRQPFDDIKRPTGFPDFMPLADLKDPYLVEDTLFIKFIVNLPPSG